MDIQGQFNDKVVLVTGAANGIGENAAQAFAIQGAEVVLADIDTTGQQVAERLCAQGHGVRSSAWSKWRRRTG